MKRGLVIKTTGSWHVVLSGDERIQCKLKGTFRVQQIRNTNPIAVGDHVEFERTGANRGVIHKIESRNNYIIRKATNLSRDSHILAANVDQLFLMVTIKHPVVNYEFIDRFLMTAEAYHIRSILVINKTDLYSQKEIAKMDELIAIYQYAGYKCLKLSLSGQANLQPVKDVLKDKISLIAGNSGVGKTTLINMLCPEANLKTSEISSYHLSGKHTTTYPEMIALPFSGYVIDTPGIRGFGITDMEKSETGLYFTDIFRLSKNCQFYNCTHIQEPGCAVISAMEKGILHESRYRSYLKIFQDNHKKYRTG